MDRRGFLLGMLALGAAPAIVRASYLMPVVARNRLLFTDSGGLQYWCWEGTLDEGFGLIIPNLGFSIGQAIGEFIVPSQSVARPNLKDLLLVERTTL